MKANRQVTPVTAYSSAVSDNSWLRLISSISSCTTCGTIFCRRRPVFRVYVVCVRVFVWLRARVHVCEGKDCVFVRFLLVCLCVRDEACVGVPVGSASQSSNSHATSPAVFASSLRTNASTSSSTMVSPSCVSGFVRIGFCLSRSLSPGFVYACLNHGKNHKDIFLEIIMAPLQQYPNPNVSRQ